jgi:hypothetical protein
MVRAREPNALTDCVLPWPRHPREGFVDDDGQWTIRRIGALEPCSA